MPAIMEALYRGVEPERLPHGHGQWKALDAFKNRECSDLDARILHRNLTNR